MSKLIIPLAALLLVVSQIFAQDSTTVQDEFRRGLALHDSGDYDGAIAIYRKLLATMPENEQIKYELTFSTFAKGDMAETIRLATDAASKKGQYQVRYLELLGNAYDTQRDPAKAVAAYKRGIKLDPNYAPIHFNLGVTYSGQGKLRDAREELERAIELDGGYASPQFAIAEVYRTGGYRIPAILAYGRFVSLTAEGDRAVMAARNLLDLVNQGVKAEGAGNVNITIDPTSKRDLGDFRTLEMMLALASGSRHLPENAAKSEFEREAESFAVFLTMLSESEGDFRRGFVAKTYVPFYAAMVKAGHGGTFAHFALAPLKLDGTEAWVIGHNPEVIALKEWLGAQRLN